MKKCRRGVSLIELVVVIGIALVLSGIALPVMIQAKKQAKKLSSVSKLRDLHMATLIYRTEHDGDGVFGDIGPMGLPPSYYVAFNRFGMPISSLKSSCGHHPSDWYVVMNINYIPGDGGEAFEARALQYKENLLLYYDMNCTDPGNSIYNPYVTKLGLGVLLQGNIVKHHKPGNFLDPGWWSDPYD